MTAAFDLDREACYRALQTRDARFDGRFYTGVRSTGVYCRPICPALTPKLENCVFLPSAAAAHQMGFRPCLRCRPEIAPGLAGWRGSAATVGRALQLIAEGAMDGAGVEVLAERLGVGGRHLRRLFDQHVGAAPVAVAQTRRILFAKALLTDTGLSMTEVALAAGFGSVRRFNAVMQATYRRPPNALRRSAKAAPDGAGVTLRLPFSPPYDWEAMIGFLAPRAIAGVEQVDAERYRRSFILGDARGAVEVRPASGKSHLLAAIHTSDVAVLARVVARLRRLFDLDADITAIDAHLSADPRLAPLVSARPGLRVPGAWDGFELAVRAILGQQVSVQAACTFAGRLASAHGEQLRLAQAPDGWPHRLFPTPEAVAATDLTAIGLTRARAARLAGLARAMIEDRDLLRAYQTLDETLARLTALPGVGPWTAQYIAMRALREPDAFPASDLGLMRAMQGPQGLPSPAQLLAMAEIWRPWRAYAAMRLWLQGAPPQAMALAS
jgi:AraC family transcriptional regulator of adaptative response / DNA-3-methyladenine glycosylase II